MYRFDHARTMDIVGRLLAISSSIAFAIIVSHALLFGVVGSGVGYGLFQRAWWIGGVLGLLLGAVWGKWVASFATVWVDWAAQLLLTQGEALETLSGNGGDRRARSTVPAPPVQLKAASSRGAQPVAALATDGPAPPVPRDAERPMAPPQGEGSRVTATPIYPLPGDTTGVKPLGQLANGTVVRIAGSVLGDWVKVETADGVTGFVRVDSLESTDEQPAQ